LLWNAALIEPIAIPSSVDQTVIPAEVDSLIARSVARIEAFQDRWDQPQIEQFVAADFRHVYQSLTWIQATQPLIGSRFLEWGCGFAVVACMAARLGFTAIGIEAEPALLSNSDATVRDWSAAVERVQGNFLPPGAETLADDPMLPSLGHAVPCGYRQLGLDLDDFAIVYAYPWPGEDEFHEAVFDHYAAPGALLLMFCGPNDLRLGRKRPSQLRTTGRR
jgi:hypothetical protein